MKNLDFHVPFSGFAPTTFINCFTSVYLYCEGKKTEAEQDYECAQREEILVPAADIVQRV